MFAFAYTLTAEEAAAVFHRIPMPAKHIFTLFYIIKLIAAAVNKTAAFGVRQIMGIFTALSAQEKKTPEYSAKLRSKSQFRKVSKEDRGEFFALPEHFLRI